jgi:hypothetical protein
MGTPWKDTRNCNGVWEESIPQGDPKLKHWATSPLLWRRIERVKPEGLAYLEATAPCNSKDKYNSNSKCSGNYYGKCNGRH